jgi:hypothetical protein
MSGANGLAALSRRCIANAALWRSIQKLITTPASPHQRASPPASRACPLEASSGSAARDCCLTKGVVSGSSLDGPLTCELDEEGGPADARLGLRGCGGILCLLELALHRLSSDIQGTLPAPSGHCRVSWSARLGRAARSASSAGDSSAPDITDPGITTASLEAAARGSERTGSRRAVEATPDRKRLNVRGSL